MSNKRTCDACGSHTSSVLSAFEDGEPCPYCGLPAAAALAFEVARRRGADEQLIEMAAKATADVATAEIRIRLLESALFDIRTSTEVEGVWWNRPGRAEP